MKMPTALIAHPYPIVVDALAAIVAQAGFAVTRAGDAVATAAGVAAIPDVALIAAAFDGASVARARIAAVTGRCPRVPCAPELTPRERDVARLVAAGQRNRLIAATLGISEGTVKMHLHNVYVKLGLESRTQLAMSARALCTQ
jgi:DNA-binding NarL/FixJ family response regulator